MKVLLGHDGSKFSEAAIRDLSRAGLPDHGELLVITAADLCPHLEHSSFQPMEPLPLDTWEWIVPAAKNASEMAKRAREEAERVCHLAADSLRAALPGWKVAAEAISDSPAAALLRKADDWRPDLIVVGPHGRSGMGRLLLGSTSRQVLIHARCSVRIARETPNNQAALRLVVGVDGSSECRAAVTSLASRRWPAGTEVSVLSVLEPAAYLAISEQADATTQDAFAVLTRPACEAAKQLEHTGLRATVRIGHGPPASALVVEAQRSKSACIWLGHRGLSRLERLLIGSVSASVAAQAPCSVEVVRTQATPA